MIEKQLQGLAELKIEDETFQKIKYTNLSMIISIPAPLFDVKGRCSKRIFVLTNERRTLARTEMKKKFAINSFIAKEK